MGTTCLPSSGAYLGGHWDMSPLAAEGALLPWSPPRMEKLVSGYCALKKGDGKFSGMVVLKKGKVNKNRPQHWCCPFDRAPSWGCPPPLDDFLNTPLPYLKLMLSRDVDPGPYSQSLDFGIFGEKFRDFPGSRD